MNNPEKTQKKSPPHELFAQETPEPVRFVPSMGTIQTSTRERTLLEKTSLDAQLGALERQLATEPRKKLGRFATKSARESAQRVFDLEQEVETEQARVKTFAERAKKAFGLIRGVPSPMSDIHSSEERETDGVALLVDTFNDKLHAQGGPGILKTTGSSLDRHIHKGNCIMCGERISDRTDTFTAFESTADISLIAKDDTSAPEIQVNDNPRGSVMFVTVNDAESHGLYAHPLLPGSQETAEKILSLESYKNPNFDGEANVTSELGSAF